MYQRLPPSQFGDFKNDKKHPVFEALNIIAVAFSFLSFNSMELTFCYSPNIIACASVEMALDKVSQLHIIGSIVSFLGLPDSFQSHIDQAKNLLNECKVKQEDKK